jgi:hypothetical protein
MSFSVIFRVSNTKIGLLGVILKMIQNPGLQGVAYIIGKYSRIMSSFRSSTFYLDKQ